VTRVVSRGLLPVWLVAAATVVGAQSGEDYRVRAYIQPAQDITDQQTIRLFVEAEGEGRPEMTVTGAGSLVNLEIVEGPHRSFHQVSADGRVSTTTSLIYTLLPRQPGPAEIPSLTVDVDGRKVPTRPIRFDVARAPSGVPPVAGSSPPGSGGEEERADVFLRAQLGAPEVWVGQTVSLSVLLYSGERIESLSLAGEPGLSGFWVEPLDVDPQAEASRTSVDGRPYVVYPIIRKILVPQTAGEIPIEPFVIRIPVRQRSSDPFESLFPLGRLRTVVRRTQPLRVRVRPLPTEERPAGFDGAVGQYALRLSLDRRETTVDDAVSLTATVEGEGFLRAVGPPALDPPPDVKVFDPRVTSSSGVVRGKLLSRKSWEWVLVPTAAGELDLPELRFDYFDTAEDAYRRLTADVPTLVVREASGSPQDRLARGDIRLQRRDLAFIKAPRRPLRARASRTHERLAFLVLLLLPLAWAPATVLLARHRARLRRDQGLARERKARARARQGLRRAAKLLAGGDSASFHEEVARALVEYVADRFNRSAAGLTYDQADELLASRGLEPSLRRRYRTCLEACDFARFVPASAAGERRAEILAQARELIERLERAW
jgi:hypothetical protein